MSYRAALVALFLAVACHDHAHGEPTGWVCPPGSTLTYDNFGRQFVTTYCVRCHDSAKSGSARNGAPAFHDYDTVIGIRAVRDHIDQYAAAGPDAVNTGMPPEDPRPTPAERQQLGEWLSCMAP